MKRIALLVLCLSVVAGYAVGAQAGLGTPVELWAGVGPGDNVAPTVFKSDGSESPFSIPPGQAFVVTDISIHRLSVVDTPGLFAVNLIQDIPQGGIRSRWTFVGVLSQNAERNFTTGIEFSTPFKVENLYSSVDVVYVRLTGFFKKL